MSTCRYAIEYAYPTSSSAEEAGYSETGCYYIVWSSGRETWAFSSEEEAENWVSRVCGGLMQPVRDSNVVMEVARKNFSV